MGRRNDDEDEDDALWEMVARSVRPMHRKKPARQGKPAAHQKTGPIPVKIGRDPVLPSTGPRQPAAKGFDRSTLEKLKKGKLPLEMRLDLHGMTQEEAHSALHRFIRRAWGQGARTVLVITGKGKVGGGTLRRMLPLWLEDAELSRVVLAVTPARAKDGGDGAFYVRLRNPEKK